MFENLLRRLGLISPSKYNDFENLVLPNEHVNLVYSCGVPDNLGSVNMVSNENNVAGMHVRLPEGSGVKDGVYINLRGMMYNSGSYEEVLTRVMETEIHEMMHWGLTLEENNELGDIKHQIVFDEIVADVMEHTDTLHYDFRDYSEIDKWLMNFL